MAILKVARLGHPVLREKARPVPVAEIRSAGVQQLIDDMIETMREYDGAGLAANQVHQTLQIAVIEVDANPRYPDAAGHPADRRDQPGRHAAHRGDGGRLGGLPVGSRHARGWCRASPRCGCSASIGKANPVDLVAKDFFARVIQHETDHLNGIVYVDRMRDLRTLSHIAEWNKYWLGIREQND